MIDIDPHAAQSYVEPTVLQILRGITADAVPLAGKAVDPFWRVDALAIAHVANGDSAEADAAFRQLIDNYADTGAFQIVKVYVLKKDPDTMFVWLDHAVVASGAGMTSLRFAAFVRNCSGDRDLRRCAKKWAASTERYAPAAPARLSGQPAIFKTALKS